MVEFLFVVLIGLRDVDGIWGFIEVVSSGAFGAGVIFVVIAESKSDREVWILGTLDGE